MVSTLASPATEIGESTWRLRGELGGRNIFQYLLATPDRDQAILIDAGTSAAPRDVVAPALRSLGIAPGALSLAIVTHPDLDHQGGLAGTAEMAGSGMQTACGFYDRAMVSDPERLLEDRYQAYMHDHGVGFDAAEGEFMRGLSGAPVDIDVAFSGGETVELGDRRLEILHAPGHSAGHLVVHEPATGALFSSDAVHGTACPGIDGSPAMCPTYEEVDLYLGSVEMLEALDPAELHSGHWPERSGTEVSEFLSASREFVALVDRVILDGLSASPSTLAELCERVQEEAGPWSSDPGLLRFCVHGHLRRLVRSGLVGIPEPASHPTVFAAAAPPAKQSETRT